MFLITLLFASRPLLLFASFTYVLASTAHLHIYQLFTYCLFTICVTLIYTVKNNCFIYTFFILIVLLFALDVYFCKYICHLVFPAYSVFVWTYFVRAWFFPTSFIGSLYLFYFCDPFGSFNISEYVWCCSFLVVSILLPIFRRQQIGWSYCAARRTWNDAIQIKMSVCHAIGMLLVA